MGKGKKRVSTDGGSELGATPFGALDLGNLPSGPRPSAPQPAAKPSASEKKNRGRLDVKREKSGRGGKTVTVVSGWKGIAAEEKAVLAKSIQKRCGVGGAVKNGNIEIQGDKREETRAILEDAGFRVVFAGG
ncbi:translation initiation factor [Pelagicoccus sp. NFK12]|uniref:Translation initiation factor n=1 Tax=Pelagicoccus enzymogenes TaxID=2773457 RepID=A0A927F8X3_9BACT|nr:translation initiation factor [Pelagicoccus enzymogenes]MBD5780502.1 translation initiation factor [Pelagicoccus enzymogenes]MDQ8197598.1 translation initiation factor [Pelagicoccus enzymogenes]